ncbi:CNNM domain-containing protein [Rubricoccus marinus]|uniref:CNNM domain-containing protein n=1 Tax=Rubricoccus marinus TaxID=716817 RepID=UPI001C530447|nr:hemolysin family protein [Rubricoccus marinus]
MLLFLVPGGAVGTGSGSLTLLILYIALAIGVSFLCSVLEAVLLSVSPAYIGNLSATKPKAAERLKGLKADVERPLAAILSLNTVAHTIGAAGAGAEAAAYFGNEAIGIFSAVLTLGILVLSEIIPKTLGAVYWRGLAPLVSRVLPWLIWITIPLVWLSQGITKLIARGEKEGSVSREEIAALAQIGHEEGVFDKSESRILASLLRFNELKARDVMTPRTVTVAFDESTPLATVAEQKTFSRLPLYTGSMDNVTGYVLRDEVLAAVAGGEGEVPASSLRRDVLSVAHDLPLPQVFEQLLDRQEHLAVVVGEYGGTAGVVTVEDVIETLLDVEIVDEVDTDHDMQAAARERWESRARKLGLSPEAAEKASKQVASEKKAVVELGLTGGVPPVDEA